MNLLEKIINKIRYKISLIQIKKYLNKSGENSSISDNGIYPAFCRLASEQDNIFKNFRTNPIYNTILEHLDKKQGLEYLQVIKSQENEIKPFSHEDWTEFLKNDSYGNPKKYVYNINGNSYIVSPTTLRYVKVLQDLIIYFDYNNIKTIAEIGIGYGGQMRIIGSYLKDVSITLFDLPETNKLAKRFLSNYNLSSKLDFVDANKPFNPNNIIFDFVMSNYAFSELTREYQDKYLQEVILKSKSGYITYNELSKLELNGYSAEELLKLIPNSRTIEEKPSTYKNNCIIIWGTK